MVHIPAGGGGRVLLVMLDQRNASNCLDTSIGALVMGMAMGVAAGMYATVFLEEKLFPTPSSFSAGRNRVA